MRAKKDPSCTQNNGIVPKRNQLPLILVIVLGVILLGYAPALLVLGVPAEVVVAVVPAAVPPLAALAWGLATAGRRLSPVRARGGVA
jgi:hypothetical protein